ncbi:integration host factor subunit alpha [Oryzomonas sagensis]|uniref:Integration host factor subunit alpha n=1 Tax=Oryzomonas sagensis TaxID=2603857 RepID=A0ABQ6TLE7_9BACT|nr:integration host factor subunit alpha [Oryzomonas sagensis]KAB0669001.1 integration host factor subunit alpha [Oryzomonas sagensis]
MTKADIAKRIQDKLRVTTKEALELFESVIELMKETLDSGETLKIAGFGSFVVKQKNPRRGRNPQTGESIMLNGRRVVTFKSSVLLRKAVNGISDGEGV